jgi:hypothetical protein
VIAHILRKGLLEEHYWAIRVFARHDQQIPATDHVTANIREEAGHLNLLDDGTSLILSVDKDIPLRYAFKEGSWDNGGRYLSLQLAIACRHIFMQER